MLLPLTASATGQAQQPLEAVSRAPLAARIKALRRPAA
jgi:hypothetical protein